MCLEKRVATNLALRGDHAPNGAVDTEVLKEFKRVVVIRWNAFKNRFWFGRKFVRRRVITEGHVQFLWCRDETPCEFL